MKVVFRVRAKIENIITKLKSTFSTLIIYITLYYAYS